MSIQPAVATGTAAIWGLRIEQAVPDRQCGIPAFLAPTGAVTALTALTAATGAAGSVAASSALYYHAGVTAEGLTALSAASNDVAPADEEVDLTVPVSADARVTERMIFRSLDSGPKLWIHTIPDNTTTAYTDDTASGSELEQVSSAPLADQTAANYGLNCLRIDPGSSAERKDSRIKTEELTGSLGEAPSLPGPITFAVDQKLPDSPVVAPYAFNGLFGKPTVVHVAATNVYQASYVPTDDPTDSISYSALASLGGRNTQSDLVYGIKWSEVTVVVAQGKETSIQMKGMGIDGTQHNVGEVVTNTGTYKRYLPVLSGLRQDFLDALTWATATTYIYAKLVTTAADGFTEWKFKVGEGAYGSTKTKVYFDASNGHQIKGGLNSSLKVEIFDAVDVAVGQDSSAREPLQLIVPGDLRTLATNDEFRFKPTVIPPGVGTGMTGVMRRYVLGPHFTAAHSILKWKPYGAANYSLLEHDGLTVKIMRPLKYFSNFGAEAMKSADGDPDDVFSLDFNIQRRLADRMFDRALATNRHVTIEWDLDCGPIFLNGAAQPAYRHIARIGIPNGMIQSSVHPLTKGVIQSTISIQAEQPADGSASIVPFIQTGVPFAIAA